MHVGECQEARVLYQSHPASPHPTHQLMTALTQLTPRPPAPSPTQARSWDMRTRTSTAMCAHSAEASRPPSSRRWFGDACVGGNALLVSMRGLHTVTWARESYLRLGVEVGEWRGLGVSVTSDWALPSSLAPNHRHVESPSFTCTEQVEADLKKLSKAKPKLPWNREGSRGGKKTAQAAGGAPGAGQQKGGGKRK